VRDSLGTFVNKIIFLRSWTNTPSWKNNERYGGVKTELHAFLTSALDRVGSSSHSDRFISEERALPFRYETVWAVQPFWMWLKENICAYQESNPSHQARSCPFIWLACASSKDSYYNSDIFWNLSFELAFQLNWAYSKWFFLNTQHINTHHRVQVWTGQD
jgi:hypothetical protein